MRFYSDSTDTIDVQWYFVSPKNPQMPWSSAFTSLIYERKDTIQPTLGERYRPVPWRGGLPPKALSVGGICGTVRQWQQGSVQSDPIPGFYPNTSIPVCCNPPPATVFGGIAIGGRFSGPVPVDICVPGPLIPEQVQANWRFTGSGPPPNLPFWGRAPDYTLLLGEATQIGALIWQTPFLRPPPALSGQCGFWQTLLNCDAVPYTWHDFFTVPPTCPDTSWENLTPQGEETSLSITPFQIVYEIAAGAMAGWEITVTPAAPDSNYVTGCCPKGFGATRTLTVSGGGLAGSITTTAYVAGATWFFVGNVSGCAHPLSANLQCNSPGSGDLWSIQILNSLCIPAGLYVASTVNCDLPVITFDLPGGISGVIT